MKANTFGVPLPVPARAARPRQAGQGCGATDLSHLRRRQTDDQPGFHRHQHAPAAQPFATPPTTESPREVDGQGGGDDRAGCPVTEDALLTALKNKYRDHTLPKGQTLRRIQCYQDYAIAGRLTPGFDSDVQTFTFSAGTWRSFNGGSGGYCDGVPAAVKRYFRAHDYPGCV
jgi:hypothetical protein